MLENLSDTEIDSPSTFPTYASHKCFRIIIKSLTPRHSCDIDVGNENKKIVTSALSFDLIRCQNNILHSV